jgi:hypothetical protein
VIFVGWCIDRSRIGESRRSSDVTNVRACVRRSPIRGWRCAPSGIVLECVLIRVVSRIAAKAPLFTLSGSSRSEVRYETRDRHYREDAPQLSRVPYAPAGKAIESAQSRSRQHRCHVRVSQSLSHDAFLRGDSRRQWRVRDASRRVCLSFSGAVYSSVTSQPKLSPDRRAIRGKKLQLFREMALDGFEICCSSAHEHGECRADQRRQIQRRRRRMRQLPSLS